MPDSAAVQTKDSSPEAILGTESIGKLLFKFGAPGIISLVVNSIYSIVDQIFIGQGVGYLGNAATNIVFPIFMFVLACGLLFGDGAAANISLYLGMGQKKKASEAAAFSSLFSLITGVILACIFLICLKPMCIAFGATEANLSYCLDYGTIISAAIPSGIICCSYSSIIRADGKPGTGMAGLLMGCGINLVLDPIFIFVFHWGVKGAALATILGQIANSILYLYSVFKRPKFIEFNKEIFRSCPGRGKDVLKLGVSSFAVQLAIVVAIVIQNRVLATVGAQSIYGADIPLAALGITMKVFSIVNSVVVGLSGGAQPIYGYNYGKKQTGRVKKTFCLVLIVSTAVLFSAFLIFQIDPMAVVSLFGSEEALYNEFAVRCMKIFLLGLPLLGLSSCTGGFFQALGRPLPAALTSLSRQIIFMIPTLFILVTLFGIDGCLYTGPVADVLASIFCVILLRIYWKKLFPENSPVQKDGSDL